MIGAWIRRTGFWFIDFIKGSPVRKHYADITEKKKNKSAGQLADILMYATEHVPFYRDIKSTDIKDFPVMSKPIYKQQGTNCISDEYHDYQNLRKACTSGSTGAPMVVYLNPDKRNRVIADLIHAHETVNWKLGEKYVFIRNWVSNYKQSRLKQIAENVLHINIATFDDDRKQSLYAHLRKHKGYVVFGYASAICDFMRFIKRKNLNGAELHIKLIICDSDELTKTNRLLLEHTFSCPVVNRYDNEENGFLGISAPGGDILNMNRASLFIELLKPESDERVNPGEIGRVVITDLYNKSMPLIRYDTGDLAKSNDSPEDIRTLLGLCGRTSDCLKSIDGKLVSSVAISAVTEIFESIVKYQLIQNTAVDFVFNYIGDLSEEDSDKLDARLKSTLGQGANVEYINVKELNSGKNGKFKTIINNCS